MRRCRWLALVAVLVLCPIASTAQPPDPHRATAPDAESLTYGQVNGVRLAYRVDGKGTPVIFVHREPGSHEQWVKQVEPFARQHLVVTYDRRGNGMSEAPAFGYSPLAHAEDLDALMSHFGIPDAHFVVSSRGGVIILESLKRHPEKVRSIVFADAVVPLVPLSPLFKAIIDRRVNGPIPTLEETLHLREARKTLPSLAVARTMPDVRAVLDRMVDQYSPRVYMNPQASDISTLEAAWHERDLPDMNRLRKPVLLLVGEHTDALFMDGSKEAQRRWPGARLHILPDTDHLLMLEAPAEFNRLTLEFLREVDARLASERSPR